MERRGLVINFSNRWLNHKGTYRETASLKTRPEQFNTKQIHKLGFNLNCMTFWWLQFAGNFLWGVAHIFVQIFNVRYQLNLPTSSFWLRSCDGIFPSFVRLSCLMIMTAALRCPHWGGGYRFITAERGNCGDGVVVWSAAAGVAATGFPYNKLIYLHKTCSG